MVKEPTVLILGAGASKPYGFPLGSELRDDVIRRRNGSATRSLLFQIGISDHEYESFLEELSKSGYSSVDAFLEDRKQWLQVGKACIAQSLLEYEGLNPSSLFPPNQPKDHWYEILWSHLKADSWQSFQDNKLTIVTFNYDRSLEHYLSHVLCNNYGVHEELPATFLESLIIHVHGHLGKYTGRLDYGYSPTKNKVIIAKDSIKIVHESDSSTREFKRANHVLEEARWVYFVGFAFHGQNMRKMSIFNKPQDKLIRGRPFIRGTHKGINARVCGAICNKYGFAPIAFQHTSGSISENLSEWL